MVEQAENRPHRAIRLFFAGRIDRPAAVGRRWMGDAVPVAFADCCGGIAMPAQSLGHEALADAHAVHGMAAVEFVGKLAATDAELLMKVDDTLPDPIRFATAVLS